MADDDSKHCSDMHAPDNWNRVLYEGSYGKDNYVEKTFLQSLFINPDYGTVSVLQYFYSNIPFAVKILAITIPLVLLFIICDLMEEGISLSGYGSHLLIGFLLGGSICWIFATRFMKRIRNSLVIKTMNWLCRIVIYFCLFSLRQEIIGTTVIVIDTIVLMVYLFICPILDRTQLSSFSLSVYSIFILITSLFLPSLPSLLFYLPLSFLFAVSVSYIPSYYPKYYKVLSLYVVLISILCFLLYYFHNIYMCNVYSIIMGYTLLIGPFIQYYFQFDKQVYMGPWIIPRVPVVSYHEE
ncbi:hypothetical protein WA158_008021 [Blastocystis sp. Blastoise]